MGYFRHYSAYSYTNNHRTLICYIISFLFLLNYFSISCAGRSLGIIPRAHSQGEKMILRGQIGSRPPRCERRCNYCGHCEAIQVPTNPQIKAGRKGSNSSKTTTNIGGGRGFSIANSRSDDSNYKPMSWKCKCGNLLFNP